MMESCHRYGIPMHVVSGGINDIIEGCFETIIESNEIGSESAIKCWENMGVFSNEFHYHNEKTISFSKPVIHCLNKKEFLYNENTFKKFRKNVIIMGDLIEDIGMACTKSHDNILKIGFLNNLKKNGDKLGPYLENYDIIIAGDGNLNIVSYLMQKLFDKVDNNVLYDVSQTQGF